MIAITDVRNKTQAAFASNDSSKRFTVQLVDHRSLDWYRAGVFATMSSAENSLLIAGADLSDQEIGDRRQRKLSLRDTKRRSVGPRFRLRVITASRLFPNTRPESRLLLPTTPFELYPFSHSSHPLFLCYPQREPHAVVATEPHPQHRLLQAHPLVAISGGHAPHLFLP